jgi:hypothetical protein
MRRSLARLDAALWRCGTKNNHARPRLFVVLRGFRAGFRPVPRDGDPGDDDIARSSGRAACHPSSTQSISFGISRKPRGERNTNDNDEFSNTRRDLRGPAPQWWWGPR